jgi:hypothetical protein
MDNIDIENRFTFHPASKEQGELYSSIRADARNYAVFLTSNCPASRELSLAVTHLEEAVFWANASIARHTNG